MPGSYQGVRGGRNSYTAADIDAAVTAFHELKPVFTPRAKIGHNTKQALLAADELPAAGHITNAYRKGDRLVVDVDHVPAKFAQLIKAGAYGDRSAELLLNADFSGKTYPLVLKGFAWLGATPPAVAGLSDIEALYARPDGPPVYEGGTVAMVYLAATHAPMTGEHEHPHPALGDQAGDATHEHPHAHGADGSPDANHDHPHGDEAQMAEAPTKAEGGKSFGKEDFAYAPSDSPSDWKLRLTGSPGGVPDAGIVGAAAAALGPGYRGQKVSIPDSDRPAVIARVRAAWKKANPDKQDDELPDVLKAEAKHSRWSLAALARLVGLATDSGMTTVALADGPDAGDRRGIDLLRQAISLVEQFVVMEAQEQASGEDEDDDIRGALAARDLLQQLVTGELAETAGIDDLAGAAPVFYAIAEPDAPALTDALDTIKHHLDSTGKRKRGVGMARVAHRMLAAYASGFVQAPAAPLGTIGPDGETGAELTGGVTIKHARQEGETMQDSELRALLGIDEQADIKQALLGLKGRSVDLAQYNALEERLAAQDEKFVALAEKETTREATLLVEQAISEHKIAPRQREWAMGRALKDRGDFEVFLASAPATAWPSGETGSGGDDTGAPHALTSEDAAVARRLGIAVSEMTSQETFEARLEKAKHDALDSTYTRNRR